MTLAHALVVSNNVIPVKLFLRIGPDPIIRLLQTTGLPGPFDPYPALTLGCLECTPFDVVHMFNTIIQQGTPRALYCIEWIKDSSGRKIMRHATEPNMESALPWLYSSQVVSVLQLISRRMASSYNGAWIAGDFACKTGTTNQQRSCWFAGATPRYTGVVYLGSDTNESLEHLVYSGRHAMPILVETLRPFSAKDDHFYHAPGLQERFVDPSNGTFLPDICSNCYTFLCPSVDGATPFSRTIC
jgi:membrane peptidoglycan carboxypeptidase